MSKQEERDMRRQEEADMDECTAQAAKELTALQEMQEQNHEAAEAPELTNTYRKDEDEGPKRDPEMEKLIEPLLDRVLAQRIRETEEVVGGIVIPDEAQEKCTDAIVRCVGAGRVTENGTLVPLKVKPGDKVILPSYGVTELEIAGIKYLLLREEQIEAIIHEEEEEETASE